MSGCSCCTEVVEAREGLRTPWIGPTKAVLVLVAVLVAVEVERMAAACMGILLFHSCTKESRKLGAERDARCIEEGSVVMGAATRKDKEGDVVIIVEVDDIVSESGVNRRFDRRLNGVSSSKLWAMNLAEADSSSLVLTLKITGNRW
jgi:hypothetical protein